MIGIKTENNMLRCAVTALENVLLLSKGRMWKIFLDMPHGKIIGKKYRGKKFTDG